MEERFSVDSAHSLHWLCLKSLARCALLHAIAFGNYRTAMTLCNVHCTRILLPGLTFCTVLAGLFYGEITLVGLGGAVG